MVIVFFCGACRTNVIGEAVDTRLVEAGFVVADDSGRFRVSPRQQAPYYYLGFGRPAGSRARRYGTRVGKELLADPWRIAEITSGPRRCSGRRRHKCRPAQAWNDGAPAGEVAGAGLKVWWRRGRSRGIASEQGLKSGDVIRELGDLKVVTPEEVRKAMGEAQKEIASMPRGGYAAHADEIRQYD